MEPTGSLPHSQQPATWPYSEPDQSSQRPISYFSKINIDILCPSKPSSTKWPLYLTPPPSIRPYTHPSSIRSTSLAHLILVDLIIRVKFGAGVHTKVYCTWERDLWGDQDVDGRIILRWILRKWEGVVGTGWSWLRTGKGGGRLWVR